MSALSRYKPPGRLVKVDGGQVHIVEAGAGSPTIVFESGMGGNVLDWTRWLSTPSAPAVMLVRRRVAVGMSNARQAVVAGLVLAALGLAACAPAPSPAPSAPNGGLDRAQAIARAMPAVADSTTPVTVLRAEAVRYRDVVAGVEAAAADRWVWSVTFRGTFPALHCPSGQATCVGTTSRQLVLDYVTGEKLREVSPAP